MFSQLSHILTIDELSFNCFIFEIEKKNYRFNEKQLILLEIKSIFEKSFCEWQFTEKNFFKTL